MLFIFTKKLLASLRTFLENEQFERIPLRTLKTGHYQLSLKINHVQGNFILDTGASTSCIGLESVDHFRLFSEESDVKAAGAGALDMETKVAKGNHLVLGARIITGFEIILFDLSHVNGALAQVEEKPIHGILGADLLKRVRAVIDYGRNCVYIK